MRILSTILLLTMGCGDYHDPRYDVLPIVDPHDGHAGGPGCGSWTMPVLPHVPLTARALGVGGPGALGVGGVVRVVTLNAHHLERQSNGGHAYYLASLIKMQRPDVVVLQELDRGTERAGGADQAAVLAEFLDMNFVYAPAMEWGGGDVGVGVLSRWPIVAWEAHQLPMVPSLEPRVAIAVRIAPGEGLPDFLVIGTHLCHISADWRLAQAGELLRLVGESDLPVILAGDLNAPREDAALVLLLDVLDDAGAAGARIDHVLVRGGWEILGAWAVGDPQLDHPVLVSKLGWNLELNR